MRIKKLKLRSIPAAVEALARGVKYIFLNFFNIGSDEIIFALKAQKYNFDTGIDVGAATGDWCTAMQRYLGIRVIIAFEPSDRFYLSTLVAILPLRFFGKVELSKSIVTSTPENKYLITHENGTALNYRSFSHACIKGNQRGILLDTTKLSDLNIEGSSILLKIDVEGNELDVMKSGDAVFYSKVSAIVFEVNKTDQRQFILRDISHFLDQFGFKIFVSDKKEFYLEENANSDQKNSVNLIALK